MLHFMQIEDKYLEDLKLSIESNYAICDGKKIYPVKGEAIEYLTSRSHILMDKENTP